MRRRILRRLGLSLALAVPAPLAAQRPDSVAVHFGAYANFQYATSSVDGAPSSSFDPRLIRVAAQATIDGWILAQLVGELTPGRTGIADAFVDFRFDPRFQVRVGQFKKPFTYIYTASRTQMPLAERDTRIRGLDEELGGIALAGGGSLYPTIDGAAVIPDESAILAASVWTSRDLGASIHGTLGRFGYEVGAFNGQGASRLDEDDRKSVAARLTLAPLADLPLTLGANAQHASVVFTKSLGDLPAARRPRSGSAFSLDAEWGGFRRPGVSVVAEAAGGDDLVSGTTFRAAQGWVTYFHPTGRVRVQGLEPAARVSWGDPDTGLAGDEGWLLTPAFKLHFAGRNNLLFNWDVFVPVADEARTETALRMQAQVYF